MSKYVCVPMSTITCYSQKMASEALVWSFRVLQATYVGAEPQPWVLCKSTGHSHH